ncbi:MAG: ATP-binding cassette domain-containing protein [Sarcina sp.]
MREIVLRTNKVTKKFKEQLANNNINMTIKKGDIYGLIGKNGAGKTTIIRMITGLAHKTSGNIELLGKTSERDLEEAREHIGSLIETPAFYQDMSARENLEVSRLVRNIAGKKCIDEALELVGLSNVGKKKFKDFSLGMKQRLGIANALLGNPRFLILDEPINGLDPMGIIEIRELLKKLNKEKDMTILISSHILSELAELATCYGIINNGELIEEISAKELSDKCKKFIELDVDDAGKAVSVLETALNIVDYDVLEGNKINIYSDLDIVSKINSELSRNGVLIERIGVKGENLEEYFMSKIGGDING